MEGGSGDEQNDEDGELDGQDTRLALRDAFSDPEPKTTGEVSEIINKDRETTREILHELLDNGTIGTAVTDEGIRTWYPK